jgi:MurNAc alpha-1-phosphate uridylyltransferase|tara:strand:+ start:827 stop:1516 length:690 start_codon:yes stop_codon:yes gene_type:complete
MKIKTALILCAGLGKRVLPLSLEIPKPLLKLNNITLLENTINLLEALKIENIKLNTFYLQNQIKDFFSNQKFKAKIEIIEDGRKILDTGGGIYNLIKASDDEDFLVLNPDTIWSLNYLETIKNMQKFYFEKKIQNLLMVVSKNKSFDKRFKGDFELKLNQLFRKNKNNYIYTGCQLINRNLFKNIKNNNFSITKIWNEQLNEKKLYGHESKEEFIHITDLEIYNKLSKR